MEQFLGNHQFVDAIILFWIFSSAVSAMPEPEDQSSAFYRWLYAFLQALSGHITDAMGRRRQPYPAQANVDSPKSSR